MAECPHKEVVEYEEKDYSDGPTAYTRRGWRCLWCGQEFAPVEVKHGG